MMKKIFIDTDKPHTLYSYISKLDGDNFKFVKNENESNLVILAFDDDGEAVKKVWNYIKGQTKNFFIYFEHISNFNHVITTVSNPQSIISSLEECKHFLGIITHSTETKNTFDSKHPKLKSYILPVGVDVKDESIILKKIHRIKNAPIEFVFTGSWIDKSNNNYFNRGGHYADEIFLRVRQHIDCTLTIKSPHYLKSEKSFPSSVKKFTNYLSDDDFQNLFLNSHIYLMPSAQAHFISIAEAQSFGTMVVGNENFGFIDYIQNGYNGIIEKVNQPAQYFFQSQVINEEYINNTVTSLLSVCSDKEKLMEMCFNSYEIQKVKNSLKNYQEFFSKEDYYTQ